MDVIIDLERGSYYKNRQNLIKSTEVPKLSQAVSNLGEKLSNVVFKECEEGLKERFGLKNPLQGPGKELWVSPSDLLIGKVCLKPPLTSKHIQALTHQGILGLCLIEIRMNSLNIKNYIRSLEIGKKIEQKYWNEMEVAKETALLEQKEKMDQEFELLLKQELKTLQIEDRLKCENKIKELCCKFDDILLETLLNIEQRLLKKERLRFKVFKQELKGKYENEQKLFMEREIKNASKEFMKELQRNEEEMKQKFQNDLKSIRWQMNNHAFRQRLQYENSLNRLRHSLECKNIANIMYVLCMERRKCAQEKENFVQDYNREISKLKTANKQTTEKVINLINKLEENYAQLRVREECLRELVRQYQKFIYFALRSVPTQAEFLLSLEQLLLFELSESVKMSKEKFLKPCEETLPIGEEVEQVQTSENNTDTNELIIEDGHNCFNEVPMKETNKNFIPAFNYHDNLYVREDFRNMVSKGLEIRPSNELWNKSLDDLMKHLNIKSKESTTTIKTRSLLKNADEISLIHVDHVGINERQGSILGTRSSLEIIREKNPSLSKRFVIPSVNEVEDLDTKLAVADETDYFINKKEETQSLETPKVLNNSIIKATDSLLFGLTEKIKRKSSSYRNSGESVRKTITIEGVCASSASLISKKSCNCNNKSCNMNTRKSIQLSRKKTSTINKTKPDKLLKIYQPPKAVRSSVDTFVNKIPEAEIVGNLDSKEYLLDVERFTEDRVKSLLTLIKDKPDLISLFTSIVR